jgi:hypothetical protein
MSHVSDLSNIYNNLAPIFDFDVNFFFFKYNKESQTNTTKRFEKTHYII